MNASAIRQPFDALGTLLAAAHPQLAPDATPGGGWAKHAPRDGDHGRARHGERRGADPAGRSDLRLRWEVRAAPGAANFGRP